MPCLSQRRYLPDNCSLKRYLLILSTQHYSKPVLSLDAGRCRREEYTQTFNDGRSSRFQSLDRSIQLYRILATMVGMWSLEMLHIYAFQTDGKDATLLWKMWQNLQLYFRPRHNAHLEQTLSSLSPTDDTPNFLRLLFLCHSSLEIIVSFPAVVVCFPTHLKRFQCVSIPYRSVDIVL